MVEDSEQQLVALIRTFNQYPAYLILNAGMSLDSDFLSEFGNTIGDFVSGATYYVHQRRYAEADHRTGGLAALNKPPVSEEEEQIRQLKAGEDAYQEQQFTNAAKKLLEYLEISPNTPFPLSQRQAFAAKLLEIGDAMAERGIALPDGFFQKVRGAAVKADARIVE